LRFGANYVDFWRSSKGNVFAAIKSIPLKSCIKFSSGRVIKKDEVNETYQLVDLNNVEPGFGVLGGLEENVVFEIGSDKVFLSDADIAFSKLNSHIGYVFLIPEVISEYPIIGSTEFYPLIIDKTKIHPKVLKYLFLHERFRICTSFLRAGKSQSHPRLQKDDFFNMQIPCLSDSLQDRILKLIGVIENRLIELRKMTMTLQDIIDSVLIKHNIKEFKSAESIEIRLNATLSDISRNKSLRIGSRYTNFWVCFDGHLMERGDNVEYRSLKEYVTVSDKTLIRKGALDEAHILIDFDQVTGLDSYINDWENIVTEIGSDKLVFGDCDLLTNKLRPYLGYTILNPRINNVIGTTEFIPIKINKPGKLRAEYLRYILLTKEYLNKSQFLASGNEHPRISVIDLLNLKIPLPSIEHQISIVEEIKEREDEAKKFKAEYKQLRAFLDGEIERFLIESGTVISSVSRTK
jgi:restriction endonuclease S subunit